MFIALGAILANLPFAACAADVVPNLMLSATARPKSPPRRDSAKLWIFAWPKKERAKDDFTQQWAKFAREDKLSCIRATSADGVPSYVEHQTCLEIASDNKTSLKAKQ